MKHSITIKKYIIRFVGALCILAAAALFFFQPMIQIDGIKNKELRTIYAQAEEILQQEENMMLKSIEADKFKEDL